MLELKFHTWDDKTHTYPLKEGRTRVGRTSQNDLQIDDLALSAHHCEFQVTESEVIVRDLDSASGTFLDGELIKEIKVSAGQVINLGTFSVEVRDASEGPNRIPNVAPLAPPVQLVDGSYSCQSHTGKRAEYECESCFALFCSDCFQGVSSDRSVWGCPRCGQSLTAVDWSGMERTKEDVVMELVPDGVKRALDYWQRYRSWEQDRKGKLPKDRS